MEDLRAILPSYQQTKIIHGAKILEIVEERDGYSLTLDTNELRGMITPRENPTEHERRWELSYEPGGKHYNNECYKVQVDFAWVSKHSPVVGGYFVLYPDGYKSFSPAEPFESGNVLRTVDWDAPDPVHVDHLFFQLRHNLNTIRWGHQKVEKVLPTLIEDFGEVAETKIWVVGKSVAPMLEKQGIKTAPVKRRGDVYLFVDVEGKYLPDDILIIAEVKGQSLVRHIASWVVIEE